MDRGQLRKYFVDCGLSYSNIKIIHLRMLEALIQIEFEKIKVDDIFEKCIYWDRVNKSKYYKGKYNTDGSLICAFMTAKGGYFNCREVVSFNENGFIGFCGEADGTNIIPVANGFKNWCDWLKEIANGK